MKAKITETSSRFDQSHQVEVGMEWVWYIKTLHYWSGYPLKCLFNVEYDDKWLDQLFGVMLTPYVKLTVNLLILHWAGNVHIMWSLLTAPLEDIVFLTKESNLFLAPDPGSSNHSRGSWHEDLRWISWDESMWLCDEGRIFRFHMIPHNPKMFVISSSKPYCM